jgi:hypothetical protein
VPRPAARPRQDALRLGGVERAALAEDVDPAHERAHRFEHGAAHEVEVRGAVVFVLRRHDVRTEECDLVGDLGRESRERSSPATVRS